ncbi:MAG: class I SAM-dependent methyltransferase [Phycisphaerae bacterium]
MYDSDEEFYSRQILGTAPHDNNQIVKFNIAEAIRFLMVGGRLHHTQPTIERANPNFSPDVKFLDVGCRDGWSLSYLKKGCPAGFGVFMPRKRFKNVFGLELSRQTVEYARSKGRNVIDGDIRNLVIEENSFDIIFTRHCLEHLDRPFDALKNIAAMLKPGGVLLAIVPQESSDIDVTKSLHSYQFRGNGELADLVSAVGLKIVNSFHRGKYSYRRRKYWYKLPAKLRETGPELWVLAAKP